MAITTEKRKRVCFYVRVSTKGQTVENQLLKLKRAADFHNWDVVAVFKDEGISGAYGRSKRKGYDDLYKIIQEKKIDIVAAWSVDRLGRSFQECVDLLVFLRKNEVGIYLDRDNIDIDGPYGRALYHLLGVFAELQREMIVENIKAGFERGKSNGKVYGKHLTKWKKKDIERVQLLREEGASCREISRITGMGLGSVGRICKQGSEVQCAS